MQKKIKTFTVKTSHKNLAGELGRALGYKIMTLQQNGWKIDSITPINTMGYDSDLNEWFDITCYVIVAEKNSDKIGIDI